MKIVINRCYGGFSLSDFAVHELGLCSAYDYIPRNDPVLISLVEIYGSEKVGSSHYASLKIVQIPAEATDWMIEDYDGMERIVYVLNGKLWYTL